MSDSKERAAAPSIEEPAGITTANDANVAAVSPAKPQKSFFQAALPVFAAGAGLFSDGYVGNVIGQVITLLGKEFGDTYALSTPAKVLPAIAFAGTVVGQLFFGFLADHWSRTHSLVISTIILIVFTALAAGSYWHGEPVGMFNMLVAWRFFVGIGIGGEYPAGSVASAEATGELKSGTRHRWFILFTNTMIDWGFVIGALVPYIAVVCTTNLDAAWRASLAVGVLFPMVLLVLRFRLKEPEEFSKESMRHSTPYTHVFAYYWWRLTLVSLIWFIYDFSAYSFGIYSSSILNGIYGKDAPITTVFGWAIVINLFYIPGTMIGAFVSDRLGPKVTLMIGLGMQALMGFIMAGVYAKISKSIAAFAVVYGIFLAFGEFGPGNNIGLIASKTCATGVRGRYYAIAAAIGKIGAFVGTYVLPEIKKAAGGDEIKENQYPFWVASSLAVLALILAWFIPIIGQDTIHEEDARFRAYLESKGWDTRLLGLKSKDSSGEFGNVEHITNDDTQDKL